MTATPKHHDRSEPQDICLLLRVHGEAHWLIAELVPVLRELEQPWDIPDEQLGAALAYLEVLWLDACRRAAETDAAFAAVDPVEEQRDPVLHENAHRYHAAVRRLRRSLGRRVERRTWLSDDALGHEHARR